MKELDIDVALIQETKLRKSDRSPRVPGYASIRQDRTRDVAGGGLISFIKHSLIFREERILPLLTTFQRYHHSISRLPSADGST